MDNHVRNDTRRHDKRRNIESTAGRTRMSNGVTGEPGKPQPTGDTNRDTSVATVRERIERLRHEVVNHVGDQFDDMMTDVMDELEVIDKFEGANALRLDEKEKLYCDKRKSENNGELAEKQFLRRNSVLTDLYEIKHFRTIYNIFLVILILLFIDSAIYDLMHTGSTSLGVKLIMMGFAKFPIVLVTWLIMIASTFGVYGACCYWAHQRVAMSPKSWNQKAWDYGGILLFIAYQLSLLVFPAKTIIWAGLPPVSALVILTEQLRLLMKIHAFVRSTAPIALSYKPHSDSGDFVYPGFNKFLYFMFAPTLIYRDTYPRTKDIRWRFVFWHLTEVILVIFNMSFLFERSLLPPFEDFGRQPFDAQSFVLKIHASWLPGIFTFVSGFYCLLHAWMNAAAEVMKFGDRLFYKDWWNSTNHAAYYPRWNVVVHDWLYTYIYKDMYEFVTRGNRGLSIFTVFFVSSIFHEYILVLALGFLFPVMFMMFGVLGFSLIFLPKTTRPTGNIFLWFSLCTGSGMMISLYAMEYFARLNCPQLHDGITDLIIPRSFFCFRDRAFPYTV